MAAGSGTLARLGRRADSSRWLDRGVRLGLVAYGLVHLLVAWLALRLALGDASGQASSTGALQHLVRQPFGGLLIWVVAIGMSLLVLWRLAEAAAGDPYASGGGLGRRLASLGKAILYGAIAVSAIRIALHTGSSSGGGQDSMTARVMDLPGGRWLVGLVGVAIIGYGANLIRRAWTGKFREHLSAEGERGEAGRAYVAFGRVGYVAKGIAIAIVGSLFCYAAITHQARKSGGLDQALRTVLHQPYGEPLLIAIAIGIACYGLFCFARARHLLR